MDSKATELHRTSWALHTSDEVWSSRRGTTIDRSIRRRATLPRVGERKVASHAGKTALACSRLALLCAAHIRVCSHADSQALKCHSSSIRTHRGACTLAPIRQARDELEALGYEQPVFLVLRFGAILNVTLNLQHSLLANLVALNHRSILVGKTMGIRPRGTRNLPVNWPRDVAIPF